jgi:hypothetical protein
VQAPLGFRCSSLALFNCGNFDSPFGLPQDDAKTHGNMHFTQKNDMNQN